MNILLFILLIYVLVDRSDVLGVGFMRLFVSGGLSVVDDALRRICLSMTLWLLVLLFAHWRFLVLSYRDLSYLFMWVMPVSLGCVMMNHSFQSVKVVFTGNRGNHDGE